MKNKNQLIIKFIVWAGKLSAASCGVAFEKQTPDSPHLKNCVQSPQAQRISSTSLRKEKAVTSNKKLYEEGLPWWSNG